MENKKIREYKLSEHVRDWWYGMKHGEQCNMLFKHGLIVATNENINIMWTKEHGNYPR